MESTFDFAALQMEVDNEDVVEEIRNTLTEMFEWFSSLEYNREKVDAMFTMARKRPIDLDSIKEKNIFFMDKDTIFPESIPGKYKTINLGLFQDWNFSKFYGRWVYPVRDVNGKVMGFCGWDYETPYAKYLDSVTYGYSAKKGTLYGMEELPEYYRSNKPVFVVEGIVCALYLRSKGFQALALLGSGVSNAVAEILRRFGERCVVIPDNDASGYKLLKQVKKKVPKARAFISNVSKDIDSTREVDNYRYEEPLLRDLRNIDNIFQPKEVLAFLK